MSAVQSQIGGKKVANRLFHRNAAVLAAVIVGVPNLLFLLIAPWFLVRRMLSPIVYLAAGLIAIFLPWPAAGVLLVVATIVDVFFIISYTFDMPFDVALKSLRYSGDINVTASPFYVFLAFYFCTIPAVVTYLARKYRSQLRAVSPILATALAFGIAFIDLQVNGYKPLEYPPFESAVAQNGLNAGAIIARDRNLLIVLVEGMGAFSDPTERAILSNRLEAASRNRYRITTGTSNYYGSTTGAEARELCGKWATFGYYLEHGAQDCLPSELGASGYKTVSYHAGSSNMFSRREWYPHLGIKEMNFLEDIERDRPHVINGYCGTVFKGLCDADIPDIIRSDMISSRETRGLYYWLTLNSHLPYDPIPENGFACGTAHALIDTVIPCQLTEIWSAVFDKVAAMLEDPNLPPFDVLIVGDHNTPMWLRKAYNHFLPSKVDWYFIEDQRPLKDGKVFAR